MFGMIRGPINVPVRKRPTSITGKLVYSKIGPIKRTLAPKANRHVIRVTRISTHLGIRIGVRMTPTM